MNRSIRFGLFAFAIISATVVSIVAVQQLQAAAVGDCLGAIPVPSRYCDGSTPCSTANSCQPWGPYDCNAANDGLAKYAVWTNIKNYGTCTGVSQYAYITCTRCDKFYCATTNRYQN